MKFKTTKKEILKNYTKIYAIGYCETYHLFYNLRPQAYLSGVYGWNADVYVLGGYVFITGYRPFGKTIPYDIVKKYDNMARDIVKEYKFGDSDFDNKIDVNLKNFINEIQ
jgi:hypothetical protein